ncbi:MAG: catalase [Desulfitobacterium hafniense]|nr:catalase [Desulfitobacterium hafniense]MEA5024450.1 catalase [Desulfitobacterium hafniense]
MAISTGRYTMENQQTNQKSLDLDAARVSHNKGYLTTNQGVGVSNTDDSLKAGKRGPTLMEDFIFREKVTHFDHERIPERVVHARGSGAHGYFQVYENLSHLTKAHFLSDPNLITPVFVRFSTVAGFRGSSDTVRDVRGFAVKFYTQEGNYDIVGNNMPVFFIQDAIKFPDLIHSLKPEPNNEMPQAASAHDTFWDFVVNTPETMHNVMWLMSPRAVPKSFRMMEGFGINTFRLVNAKGEFKFVKFHWKPVLGVHSLVWDEAQKVAGKDPDFNRRDLWETIEHGQAVEFELGIQVLKPEDEFRFDFDILDPTKLWPEELIPVQKIGKMTLNQNPDNFFAETEQVAFCPANVVPGIDFSNDPLLQGRLFSYLDTQLSRLGGPNFHQLPINRPLPKVNNNQRDGMHRMTIDEGQTSYYPNSLNKGEPHAARAGESHFEHYQEKVDGHVIRERSESFRDHYTQPAMFWNSMSDWERQHIIDAFRFELGKCKHKPTHQKLVDMLGNVDPELAQKVAEGLGATPPANGANPTTASSPALSMANTAKSPKTRKVAVLLENGFDKAQFDALTATLIAAGACFDVVSCKLGPVTAGDNGRVEGNQTYATTASVFYDAVYIPGGSHTEALKGSADVKGFLLDTFNHYKTIGLSGEASALLGLLPSGQKPEPGIVCESAGNMEIYANNFLAALTTGRHFERNVH